MTFDQALDAFFIASTAVMLFTTPLLVVLACVELVHRIMR